MKFSSIYRQDSLKLGLILNLIDPKIGGVLFSRDRRTRKSTSIRALQSLLPSIVKLSKSNLKNHSTKLIGSKVPLVELPLRATEDRICRTIDIEKVLSSREKSFEAGLLSKANRRILYVDEINLLDDHLVDLLLDSAASRWNTVERENISITHPADFILAGSFNPEEGELRPQLLDRFRLSISVTTPKSVSLRVKILNQVVKSERSSSPLNFDSVLRKRIQIAKKRAVKISKKYKRLIAQICVNLQVDRLRRDIVLNRASRALAAWNRRNYVSLKDIETVLPFCLSHRLRKDPLDTSSDSIDRIFEAFFDLL